MSDDRKSLVEAAFAERGLLGKVQQRLAKNRHHGRLPGTWCVSLRGRFGGQGKATATAVTRYSPNAFGGNPTGSGIA